MLLVGTLGIAAEVTIHRAGPILRSRVIETLGRRFQSRVELDRLDASILRGIEVSGSGLRIYPPANLAAAGGQPLISVGHFSFRTAFSGLMAKPMHVDVVRVEGLQIDVPPGEARHAIPHRSENPRGKIEIVVDRIVCDNSRLIVGTANPAKDPRDFELKHIELRSVGPNNPWQYEAALTNAIPKGEIQAQGTFGPWQTDNPGNSSVTGRYTFRHADLSTIRGIGGMLSSTGQFQGQLNRIVVDGATETPDFSLAIAGHPLPLRTQFHAVVDGTTGDTYLQPVHARLGNANFTTSGAVVDQKGQGHTIDLDIDVPNDPLQDFLTLAIRTQPPVMTASIQTRAKLHIRAGKEDIVAKLALQGNFTIRNIRFTNPSVQEKVDMLSYRAQGQPKKARPGAPPVDSWMKGTFDLNHGAIRLANLEYVLPGARAGVAGVYSLDGQQFDFHGDVHTSVPLSRMVGSRVASLALKAISPIFKGQGQGADIPFRVSGTKSAPRFGLDVLRDR